MNPFALLLASIPFLGMVQACFRIRVLRAKLPLRALSVSSATLTWNCPNNEPCVGALGTKSEAWRKLHTIPPASFKLIDGRIRIESLGKIDELEGRQTALYFALTNTDIVCTPKTFLGRVQKEISSEEGQKKTIDRAVSMLFIHERADCIRPLLEAVNDKSLKMEHLRDFTIQRIFVEAAGHGKEIWLQLLHKNPAITDKIYSEAMDSTTLWRTHDSAFERLLQLAPLDTLKVVHKECQSGFGGPGKTKCSVIKDRLDALEQEKAKMDPKPTAQSEAQDLDVQLMACN
jgi:hypothetical protein